MDYLKSSHRDPTVPDGEEQPQEESAHHEHEGAHLLEKKLGADGLEALHEYVQACIDEALAEEEDETPEEEDEEQGHGGGLSRLEINLRRHSE